MSEIWAYATDREKEWYAEGYRRAIEDAAKVAECGDGLAFEDLTYPNCADMAARIAKAIRSLLHAKKDGQ